MRAQEAALVIDKTAYDGVIFDLDGVVTRTARVHAAAWKRLFDEYLEGRAPAPGEDLRPFDTDMDYRRYVDGKPRYDGIRSFGSSGPWTWTAPVCCPSTSATTSPTRTPSGPSAGAASPSS
jgi:hypothetical protein